MEEKETTENEQDRQVGGASKPPLNGTPIPTLNPSADGADAHNFTTPQKQVTSANHLQNVWGSAGSKEMESVAKHVQQLTHNMAYSPPSYGDDDETKTEHERPYVYGYLSRVVGGSNTNDNRAKTRQNSNRNNQNRRTQIVKIKCVDGPHNLSLLTTGPYDRNKDPELHPFALFKVDIAHLHLDKFTVDLQHVTMLTAAMLSDMPVTELDHFPLLRGKVTTDTQGTIAAQVFELNQKGRGNQSRWIHNSAALLSLCNINNHCAPLLHWQKMTKLFFGSLLVLPQTPSPHR